MKRIITTLGVIISLCVIITSCGISAPNDSAESKISTPDESTAAQTTAPETTVPETTAPAAKKKSKKSQSRRLKAPSAAGLTGLNATYGKAETAICLFITTRPY